MRAATAARRRTERRPPSLVAIYAAPAAPPIDVAKLELLLAAAERRQAMDARLAFNEDYIKLAGALPAIEENGVLRHGSEVVGAYALWEDIDAAIRPLLIQCSFALSFKVDQTDDAIAVTAVLNHRAGHAETTTVRLPPDLTGDKNSVQAVGSSVSYAKRYATSALLNLISKGEDDDGRRAAGCITAEQVQTLEAKLKACGADQGRLLGYLRVESLDVLPASRFDEALAAIAAKPPKASKTVRAA